MGKINSCNFAYNLIIPIIFPEGIHPGAGSIGNHLIIEKNGYGQSVLRGTSVIGVLRSACNELELDTSKWFGDALSYNQSNASRIVADDCIFSKNIAESVHNIIDRHTHAVTGQGLFSLERVLPASRTQLNLYLTCPNDDVEECEEFLADLISLLETGLFFGGSSARGIGRALIERDAIKFKKYDLCQIDDVANWLDDKRAIREGLVPKNWQKFELSSEIVHHCLKLDVSLNIPAGQDFLISENLEMYPRNTTTADNKEMWMLPGSSLRGVMRSWMLRLAARDGYAVYDKGSTHIFDIKDKPHEKISNQDAQQTCPIINLFGSIKKRSRIHICDGYAIKKADNSQVHLRKHVAIDRFSGGANEGALFDNYVLIDHLINFPVTITIEDPKEHEVKWLKKTLEALDMGLVRVGSSKSSGRVQLSEKPKAVGCLAEMFNDFKLYE